MLVPNLEALTPEGRKHLIEINKKLIETLKRKINIERKKETAYTLQHSQEMDKGPVSGLYLALAEECAFNIEQTELEVKVAERDLQIVENLSPSVIKPFNPGPFSPGGLGF